MNTFVSLTVCIMIFYAAFKIFKKNHPENTEYEEYAINPISEQLDNVNQAMKQLEKIEGMITEIELCNPKNHEKSISVKWMDEQCSTQSYDFWLTGNDVNTDLILKLAYAERKKLRSLLKKEITILGERSNENCYENYMIENRGVVR